MPSQVRPMQAVPQADDHASVVKCSGSASMWPSCTSSRDLKEVTTITNSGSRYMAANTISVV
jgi:hypothetical protein